MPHSIVPAAEKILDKKFKVLDKGFVRLVDYMGSDDRIVQAARVSYGTGTKTFREDKGLINYLLRNDHTSPFEQVVFTFHVKLPIFVARQWIRHRTASVNEYSGRYSVLDKEFYIPAAEDLGLQAASNRQGRGAAVSAKRAAEVLQLLREDAERSYAHYLSLLGTPEDTGPKPLKDGSPPTEGIARELARMNLNLSYYTQWYWKVDLHNLLHFLSLRLDMHAQKEIRLFAEAIAGFVKRWVPLTWEAFEDYRLGAATLSRQELAAVKEMMAGKTPDLEKLGLSKREQEEFRGRFGLEEK